MVDTQNKDYISLPRKVSNNILQLLDRNYKGFFKSLKDYKNNPNKYLGRPKLPKYKDSLKGRFIVPYEKGAISKSQFKKHHIINFSQTNIKIKTKIKSWDQIQAGRIIPTNYGFKIEIIYNKSKIENNLNKNNVLGLDLGVNNLIAGATNNGNTFLIKGTPLKSINQYYNKIKRKIQSDLEKINKNKTSKRLIKLTNKRNNKINYYLHNTSKKIIDYCLTNNIGTIIIGHNKNWKQNVNIGNKNNQNFVNIPFNTLIEQLKYKCSLNNIDCILTEESYTSKCSFIDNEPIKKHDNYLGNRVKRGLFKSSTGIIINADINGAFNIIKKVVQQFNVHNIKLLYRGYAVYPHIIKIT